MDRYEKARQDRDEALSRVGAAADETWRNEALHCLWKTAKRHAEFISDDVWETGLSRTREDRALGPVFRQAAGLEWIVKTDRVRPSVRSHLSGKPIWRSLIAEDS
jgi:hypothetical protein